MFLIFCQINFLIIVDAPLSRSLVYLTLSVSFPSLLRSSLPLLPLHTTPSFTPSLSAFPFLLISTSLWFQSLFFPRLSDETLAWMLKRRRHRVTAKKKRAKDLNTLVVLHVGNGIRPSDVRPPLFHERPRLTAWQFFLERQCHTFLSRVSIQ